MAILTPAFLLLIVIGVVHGRVAIAANAVDVAAHDAARAASITRTAAGATTAAQSAATDALNQQQLDCVGGPTVVPNTSGFAETDPSQLAVVSATVTCEVSFLDVKFLPFIPDSQVITSTFVSPIDIFRERQ